MLRCHQHQTQNLHLLLHRMNHRLKSLVVTSRLRKTITSTKTKHRNVGDPEKIQRHHSQLSIVSRSIQPRIRGSVMHLLTSSSSSRTLPKTSRHRLTSSSCLCHKGPLSLKVLLLRTLASPRRESWCRVSKRSRWNDSMRKWQYKNAVIKWSENHSQPSNRASTKPVSPRFSSIAMLVMKISPPDKRLVGTWAESTQVKATLTHEKFNDERSAPLIVNCYV